MAYRLFIGGLLILMFQGCAKIGTPTGGPEDLNPPQYIAGNPENRSENFTGSKIEIYFNEYLQLKNQNKEILISPPMKEKPAVRVIEKSIRINFNEDLKPQTTYTLNFGKSLSDLNEGNELPDFEFVFSTGAGIDSLSVTGTVTDAFTNKPESEAPMYILLYEDLSDSAPLVKIPSYYGKANLFGLFAINNIHPDTFRIIALKDINNNLKYDPGLETIGFSDSLLVIDADRVTDQTFIKDTVKIITPATKPLRGKRQDTARVADTVIAPGKLLHAVNVSLHSFMEENSKVFITSRNRDAAEKFTFVFNRPLFDSLRISPIHFAPDSNWYLLESSRNRDTLAYWITDSMVAKRDTIMLKLSYTTTDSLGLFITRTDTVKLRHQSPASAEGRGGGRRSRTEAKVEKKAGLVLSSSVTNEGLLNLNTFVGFTSPTPIKKINPEYIEMTKLQDTVYVKQPFTYNLDQQSPRKFRVTSKWEEDTKYVLLLKPGSVQNIFGLSNDSIKISFTTRNMDYYGKILLNFNSFQFPMIIQILNERNTVISSKIAKSAGVITFDYLPPDKYSIKAIYDENGNGKWDTGNYLKHIQPERIYLSGKPEQLRSNWDWEPNWTITEK